MTDALASGNYAIPAWCRMPMLDHTLVGGCWGIGSGQQPAMGEAYCKGCEFYQTNTEAKHDTAGDE